MVGDRLGSLGFGPSFAYCGLSTELYRLEVESRMSVSKWDRALRSCYIHAIQPFNPLFQSK